MVDRVACQDATAQMAVLQFMTSGMPKVSVPTTIHCDHLICAEKGAECDLAKAKEENREVYEFLRGASQKYGMGFWKPGSGIIHQIVLENYAFPGGLMIGTDSHTPNAGGLGMVACGVGGADAVDAMVGLPWEVLCPKVIGIQLTGQLRGFASPKDVIMHILGKLTTAGGTDCVLEYFGEGCESLSATGMATICNMGAELGATCSVFPYTESMARYLRATNRAFITNIASSPSLQSGLLAADPKVLQRPRRYYDKVLRVDLSKVEPAAVGPYTPDRHSVLGRRGLGQLLKDNPKIPQKVSFGLIGSCTNSSYEDMTRVADLIHQAHSAGIKPAAPLAVSPGSEQIRATLERDGILDRMSLMGNATHLANACGPCIGKWKRNDGTKKEEYNTIVTSFNRNFRARNDGNPNTQGFLASPETVALLSITGRLDFDPAKDQLTTPDGAPFCFRPPVGAELPPGGFAKSAESGYLPPPSDREHLRVDIDPKSDRIQELQPFDAWDGQDFADCPVLIKIKGKCTTDHISPAGVWLKFRGHLQNISQNLLRGGVNCVSGKANTAKNQFTGEWGETQSVAHDYKQRNVRWVIIGDTNYGEGSSREHAALEPRYLGCAAVIAKSFARIHATNLRKQGILALQLVNPADYEKLSPDARIHIRGLAALEPGKPVTIEAHTPNSAAPVIVQASHGMNEQQIGWFKAGSCLNYIKAQLKQRA
eukprot:gnl/Trimastix_PCT/795.p1 GENE.gnl/Trimastix_PCT/795~~gnl/Trimastix_PCT/795.p1  ORF type:complete len:798 (+),score=251.23 gnl/Trimastix_PCT/795:269-2395(+)